MKVVINKCFGGFGLSDAAYEQLIAWGVPAIKYSEQERGPDGLYRPQPMNDGEVIFDNELILPGESERHDKLYHTYKGRSSMTQRYWDCWTRNSRSHPLIVRLVEELGKRASGACAELAVVEIPDGVEYEISEYDGHEHIAERHRTWG
jgi:hypothetical protein